MKRIIYENLIAWKNDTKRKPLCVLGVRQCGKTYIIEEFCKNEFKNYIKVDLLARQDIIDLYKENKNSEEKFNQLQLLLNIDLQNTDTILFIDEIQESEDLIKDLKYICENHNYARIIVAGSLLGVKLKRLEKSFPVGKVRLLNMYPMNFEEFLISTNNKRYIEEIKKCYETNTPLSETIHNTLINLYRTFLTVGGMPEYLQEYIDVNQDLIKLNPNILNDIKNEYFDDFKKHVKSKTEALKIEETYKTIPMQLNNKSNKFQYSKIKQNARSSEYSSAIYWLSNAHLINQTFKVSLPEIPLEGFKDKETFKLFISDIGLLNHMLNIKPYDILNDNLSLYKGAIAENYVANELIVKNHLLYYWESDGKAEIDFLIYNEDGIIPVEVKASDNTQSKSLKVYMEKYNPKYAIRVSTKNFGYDKKTKIKSVPLYAVFCIKS